MSVFVIKSIKKNPQLLIPQCVVLLPLFLVVLLFLYLGFLMFLSHNIFLSGFFFAVYYLFFKDYIVQIIKLSISEYFSYYDTAAQNHFKMNATMICPLYAVPYVSLL